MGFLSRAAKGVKNFFSGLKPSVPSGSQANLVDKGLANISSSLGGAAKTVGSFISNIVAPKAGGDNPNMPGSYNAPTGTLIQQSLGGAGKIVPDTTENRTLINQQRSLYESAGSKVLPPTGTSSPAPRVENPYTPAPTLSDASLKGNGFGVPSAQSGTPRSFQEYSAGLGGGSARTPSSIRGGDEGVTLQFGDPSESFSPSYASASGAGGYSSPITRKGITQVIAPSSSQSNSQFFGAQPTEEDKVQERNKAIDIARAKLRGQGINDPQFFGTSLEDLSAFDPSTGQPVIERGKFREYTGVQSPNITYTNNPAGAGPQFKATVPTGALDLDSIGARMSEISSIISSGRGITAADAQSFYGELEDMRQNLIQAKQAEDPIRFQPHILETQEQFDYMNNLPPEEQKTIRQQYDAKARELGLPTINAEIAKAETELQATEQIYQEIIKDIQENPDMPKSLAAKRIDDFTKRNALTIKNLQGKLAILEKKRAYANDILDRELGLIQLEVGQEDKMRNNAMQQLNLFVSSGGIANFSEADIQSAAQATGLSIDQIRSIKTSVATKNAQEKYSQFTTQLDETGKITVLGIKPDGSVEVLKQISGIGKVTEPTQGQFTAANYATRIQQANPILDDLTEQITSMNTLSFEAQIRMKPALQTATVQSYMQAARNFINSVLRRESGAVISPSEFAEARQQYLPQPGDKPEVLNQKRQNRLLVQQNFTNEAGRAIQGGQQQAGQFQPGQAIDISQASTLPIGSVIEKGGQQYRKIGPNQWQPL